MKVFASEETVGNFLEDIKLWFSFNYKVFLDIIRLIFVAEDIQYIELHAINNFHKNFKSANSFN